MLNIFHPNPSRHTFKSLLPPLRVLAQSSMPSMEIAMLHNIDVPHFYFTSHLSQLHYFLKQPEASPLSPDLVCCLRVSMSIKSLVIPPTISRAFSSLVYSPVSLLRKLGRISAWRPKREPGPPGPLQAIPRRAFSWPWAILSWTEDLRLRSQSN